jgi:hypothetical protein
MDRFALMGLQAMSIEDTNVPLKSVSFLRCIPVAEALKSRNAIVKFFGPVQDTPASPSHEPEEQVDRPTRALWVLGAGALLMLTSAVTLILRKQLPDSVPGIYLGAFGVALLAVGAAWAWFGSRRIKKEKPETIAAKNAHSEINRQIDHFKRFADSKFGPPAAGALRAHLIGIGRMEWNDNHEVPVSDLKDEQILAAVVHLVALDLAPPMLAVHQIGLDLRNGTVREDRRSRHLITDVDIISHISLKSAATADWEQATSLVDELEKLERNDRPQAERDKVKAKLDKLKFDEPAGEKFQLVFGNGERLELVIADSSHAKNTRKVAYPIGGQDNLGRAAAAWARIAEEREKARNSEYAQRADLKQNTAETSRAIRASLDGMQQKLTSIDVSMRGIFEAVAAGAAGNSPDRAANGYAEPVHATPLPPAPTSPAPATPSLQPETAKSGA